MCNFNTLYPVQSRSLKKILLIFIVIYFVLLYNQYGNKCSEELNAEHC